MLLLPAEPADISEDLSTADKTDNLEENMQQADNEECTVLNEIDLHNINKELKMDSDSHGSFLIAETHGVELSPPVLLDLLRNHPVPGGFCRTKTCPRATSGPKKQSEPVEYDVQDFSFI